MKLFARNVWFWIAVGLMAIQQILVGFSTYCIGLAGSVVSTNPGQTSYFITLFFGAIMLAYISGGIGHWTVTRLTNAIWQKYVFALFKKIGKNLELASEKNKIPTHTWICGEAFAVIESSSIFFVNTISIFLNIVFTLIVFSLILGTFITIGVSIALVASAVSLMLAYRLLDRMAENTQKAKICSSITLQQIWDPLFFANRAIFQASQKKCEEKLASFCNLSQRSMGLEQLIACTPILLAIPLLLIIIPYGLRNDKVLLGALVATLPRTLQLFQNIHTANSCASQFLGMRRKMANLENFVQSLQPNNLLQQIKEEAILIFDVVNYNRLTLRQLIDYVQSVAVTKGRYAILGPNGSGKTSLLRVLKNKNDNAVLIGPNIYFAVASFTGSTGEQQLKLLDYLMNHQAEVFLFDEWDANLDGVNRQIIDQRLAILAQKAMFIEVRHHRLLTDKL